MSASSITTLCGPAFRSLVRAVHAAIPIALPACPPAPSPCRDSVDCRFLINDARSEIERLRRQLSGLEATRYSQHLRELNRGGCTMQASGSSTSISPAGSPRRRTYAVAPIGDVQQTASTANDMLRLHSLRSATIVTNLGTLMNVLI